MLSIYGNFCTWVILCALAFSDLVTSVGQEIIPKHMQKHNQNIHTARRHLQQDLDCPLFNQCSYDPNADQTIDWKCDSKLRLKKYTFAGEDNCNSPSTRIDLDTSAINDPCCVYHAAFITLQCEMSQWSTRSDDGGNNFALKHYDGGPAVDGTGSTYESTWQGITANTVFKTKCFEYSTGKWKSATGEITYLGTTYPFDYKGVFEFNFEDILDTTPILEAPCHDAFVTVWCGTLVHRVSVNGGLSWLLDNSGVIYGYSRYMENAFREFTFPDITAESKISLICKKDQDYLEPRIMATVSYNGMEYSTMDGLEENHFYFNGDSSGLTYSDQSEIINLPWYDLDNIPNDLKVADDAEWIYNNGNYIPLTFDFADIVSSIGTCAPTKSPTRAPTEVPTESPTEAPTITCELVEPTIPQSLQDEFNLPDSITFSQILDTIYASPMLEITCVDLSTVAKMFFATGFMEDLVCITNEPKVYGKIVNYIKKYPTFYNEDDCPVDDKFRTIIPGAFLSIGNPDLAQEKLQRVYNFIEDDIAEFSLLLTEEQKNTAIAITYTMEYCLDILSMDFCTNIGFGLAFNFKGDEPIYYKTGSQGLTLESTPDFDKLPGSRQISVSYDILGDISNVAGNSYSIDVSISPGILNELVDNILSINGQKFIDVGYSFSYLAGVDSLALSDIDTAQCVGFEFGKSIESISGAIIPSVAFGISRGSTKVIGNRQRGELKGPVISNDPTTWCINEQFFSYGCETIDLGIFGKRKICWLRPDIEP